MGLFQVSRLCVHICIPIIKNTIIHVSLYMCINAYIYIYVYIYIHIHTYMYICLYIYI